MKSLHGEKLYAALLNGKRLKDTKLYKKLNFNYVNVCPEKVVGQE